jgi:hypothetical protein
VETVSLDASFANLTIVGQQRLYGWLARLQRAWATLRGRFENFERNSQCM